VSHGSHVSLIAADLQPAEPAAEPRRLGLPQEREKAFTVRIQKRIPRVGVADYYRLPSDEALWSGIRSSANLHGVDPGKYEIGIDTRIGPTCLRALSNKVVVIGSD
jgi:hypothetical protein